MFKFCAVRSSVINFRIIIAEREIAIIYYV